MDTKGADVIGDRTWTWTLSAEQLAALWRVKNLHLFSHGIEVLLKLTGDEQAPASLQVTVSQPPLEAPREDVPNARTRQR